MPLTKVWQLNNDCAKFQETTLETVCQAKIFVLCHILIHPVLALCGSCLTSWFNHLHSWKKGHWSQSTSEKKQIFDTGMVTSLFFLFTHFYPLLVCAKDHLAGSGEGTTTHCEKKGQNNLLNINWVGDNTCFEEWRGNVNNNWDSNGTLQVQGWVFYAKQSSYL